MKIRALLFALAIGLAALLPNPAGARPGGGHSSSSHSSGGGSHSSSGSFSHYSPSFPRSGPAAYSGGEWSASEVDALIKFVVVFILFWLVLLFLIKRGNQTSITSSMTDSNRAERQARVKQQLAILKQSDPNFSGILFLDFVHALYTKFYSYSTHPEYRYLSSFLGGELQRHFADAQTWTISEVVINGIDWEEIDAEGPHVDTITLVIDANYTLDLQGKRTRYAVTERWRFARNKGLLSAEPDKMQALCCPNCGAPAHFTDAGQCENCASVIQQGQRQWYLARRVVLRTSALDAAGLVSYAKEQGTRLPTVMQDDFAELKQHFESLHGLEWGQFWPEFQEQIVKAYFLNIYQHWSDRDWQGVRHLLSDRLYDSNLFWQRLYSEQNWFNRLNDLRIERIEPVKIELDRFYEALTVRIFASCFDYTEDADGKLIGGAKRTRRRYSEYWTFVRRTGAEQAHSPYSIKQCPQCGAPADNFGQTAVCGYCGSKISTGEFSWVLFLIMQDDVYSG